MDELDELDELYNRLLDPTTLVRYFKTDEEFKSWCETGQLIDLCELLVVFENHELYEYCAVIKQVIDEKIDEVDLSSAL